MRDITTSPGSCLAPLLSVVQLLGRRWTIPLMLVLSESGSDMRYSEIREQLVSLSKKEISDSTLSKKLSELTKLGILFRKSFDEVPPRVEYSLSDVGLVLIAKLNNLGTWARDECHSGRLKVPRPGKSLQDPQQLD